MKPIRQDEVRALVTAAAEGDLSRLELQLLGSQANVNAVLGDGWSALMSAVSRGQLLVVQRLVQEQSLDLNQCTLYVLHSCIHLNAFACDNGSCTCSTGVSPLAMALRRKHNAMARLLLTHGASRSTLSTCKSESTAFR